MPPRSVLFSASALFAAASLGSAACDATGRLAGGAGDGATNGEGDGEGDILFGDDGDGPLLVEPSCEGVDPAVDNDGDGWSGAAGDCNDCTRMMNPGAQDYPGNGIDEDCNGIDDDPAGCDAALAVDSADPMDAARAIGLCKVAEGPAWGVISAAYVTADGRPLADYDPAGVGRGILSAFGPNVRPQEGARMLALSSGAARQPGDPGYASPANHDKHYETGTPLGYPKESPACPDVFAGSPHDSAGLRLVVRTPTNAKSLSFSLDFYTYEFPRYVCNIYNDFFVAMLSPVPAGQTDGNVSYDEMGNTISVNAGLLQVCHAQGASNGVHFPCPLGPSQLAGTGFDLDDAGRATENSAATGWLSSRTAIPSPGTAITIDLAIWDSGDGVLDSTVLIDDLRFGFEDTPTQTEPIPDPK